MRCSRVEWTLLVAPLVGCLGAPLTNATSASTGDAGSSTAALPPTAVSGDDRADAEGTAGRPPPPMPTTGSPPPPPPPPPDDTGGDTGDTGFGGSAGSSSSGTTGGPCAGVICLPNEECVAGLCFPVAGSDESSTGPACNTAPGMWATCSETGEVCGGVDPVCVSGPDGGTTCAFQGCTKACDCPPPAPTGDATVTCGSILGPGALDVCYLSCEAGESCPDGQVCYLGFICLVPDP